MAARSLSKMESKIFFQEVKDFMETIGGDTPDNRTKLIEATIEFVKATNNDRAFNKNRNDANVVPDPHFIYRTMRARDRLADILADRSGSMNQPNRDAFRGGMNLYLRNSMLTPTVPALTLPEPVEETPAPAPVTNTSWSAEEIVDLVEDAINEMNISRHEKHEFMARLCEIFNV